MSYGSKCEGLFYRCVISHYVTKKGIAEKKELYLLKRKSCPSCRQCDWETDMLLDAVKEESPPDFSKLVDNKIYKLVCTPSSYDNNNYVDTIEFDFIEIP